MSKGSWILLLRCEVIKQVICSDCTEEEAEENPWEYAEDVMEISNQEDEPWDVHSIDPYRE